MDRVRRAGRVPPSMVIVSETLERLGYLPGAVPPDEVLLHFNDMLRRLWEETLLTLENYEERCYANGIPRELTQSYPQDVERAEGVARREGFAAGVQSLLTEWYPRLRRAFLSVTQGRMARGGKDFELQIEGLLNLAKIPFHKQEREEHTDLILPDLETHRGNRNVSIIISVKRTLRERWAEVAEELYSLRSPNVFLFTADEDVTQEHVASICRQYNIYLVVWDRVKDKKFPEEPLVLGYTEWASQRLAFLKETWK